MLGSAIPKRWVVSLALVGLVSLLIFSDASLTSERASAQDGVGVTLTSLTSPTTASFPAGAVVGITTEIKDENGFVNASLANDNYVWASGGCGSVTTPTTEPKTTFTAGSAACTGTTMVFAYQDTATTSTVRDMDAIATDAVGVTADAAVTTAMKATALIDAVSIDVDDTTGIAVGEYIKIGDTGEIMLVGEVTDSDTLGVTRGVHGTLSLATALEVDDVVQEVTLGTNLDGAVTAAATSITVNSTANFAAGGYAKIGTEIIKITTVASGTVLNPVVRAQFGTTAGTPIDDVEVIEVTVLATLLAADVTLVVADSSVFAASDYVEIGSELLQITDIPTANTLTVLRGQMFTTAAIHAADAAITKQITKQGSTAVSVTVAAAVAATPVPTDPSPVPSIVPDGLTADDVAVILPSSGGSFTEVGGTASITVPSSAVTSGTAAAVNIVSVSSSDVPPPPAPATEGASSGTFTFGSTIIDIQWYDDGGTALDTYSLNRSAEICVPFTQADVDGADGGPDGMALWRYNGSEWVQLNSSVNISAGTVCANTSNFSSFALGLAVAAPGTASAPTGLPVTGDYSPGIGGLMLAMLAGIALVAVGAFTARRARRVRVTS